MLALKEITKHYNSGSVNEICLFEKFDFSVEEGEFVAVVGSNGSGKTSLLNLICGSIEPDDGEIFINDRAITNQKDYFRQRKIGRVYQNPSKGTCANMTILENMSLADQKGKKYGLSRGMR